MSSVSTTTPVSAAQSAFAEACALIQAQHPATSVSALLSSSTSLENVVATVQQAQDKYDARSYGKLRSWLGRLSKGIMSYAKIVDMLAQIHPEYTSIAWGTFKLVFIVC